MSSINPQVHRWCAVFLGALGLSGAISPSLLIIFGFNIDQIKCDVQGIKHTCEGGVFAG